MDTQTTIDNGKIDAYVVSQRRVDIAARIHLAPLSFHQPKRASVPTQKSTTNEDSHVVQLITRISELLVT